MDSPADSSAMECLDVRREHLEKSLRRHVQGDVRFDAGTVALYSTDASHYQIAPIGVVIPKTKVDLIAAVAVAMEQRVPIVPRGGGTSLSGQTVGAGLVIDCSKYLNEVLEVNVAQAWARVQPGVVLAQLNRELAPLGYQFGPDVATIDRASLGGMIGNNSAGSRSIKYGKTVDHVLDLDVVLTDGAPTNFGPRDSTELARLARQTDREGEIYRVVLDVVDRHADEIEKRFPKVIRRVSGYNLEALLAPAPFNLARLIVGSEGTLATVSEAKLRIVPAPKGRGVAAIHFKSIEESLGWIPSIIETAPSAIELIDEMILDLARANVEFRSKLDFVKERPGALLIVEYATESPGEVPERFNLLRAAMKDSPAFAIVEATEPALCNRIWNFRNTAAPLLATLPGGRKPVTFVEDTAVDPRRLPEFVARFREILRRHGTDGSFYGHASVGCLHIRPLLDLREKDGRKDMVAIANEVVDLVLEFEGSLSGEHGDGLARSAFNRKLFGDLLYSDFQRIKKAFDPDGLMNPGKIVEGPPITDDLREELPPAPGATLHLFDDPRTPLEIVQRCNGNGVCRRSQVGVMCPSYMATLEERHSPRGRANLFRAVFERRIEGEGPGGWVSPALDESLDLCLMCKACKTECPSSVDIARLKSEYLQQKYLHRRPPLLARMMADMRRNNRLGSMFAPFSNWFLRSAPTRWALDRFVGVDRRRKLPAFHRQSLLDWFRGRKSECTRPLGKVVLLADCFTTYNEPSVGRDAVVLLEMAGYQVFLAPICCGRTMISKGLLQDARGLVQQNIPRLLPYVEDDVPILGVEPSCLLTLKDEWLELAPGAATTAIAGSSFLVEHWLLDRAISGASQLPAPCREPMHAILHGHCHQRAAGALAKTVESLAALAGVEPTVLDSGCCGMAGSFGYEKGHYEISVRPQQIGARKTW